MAAKLDLQNETTVSMVSEMTSKVTQSITTTIKPPVPEDDDDVDDLLIVGLVLFGIGCILLLVVMVRLIMWLCNYCNKTRRLEKQRARELRHNRYLEEYSVRTGGSKDEFLSDTLKSEKSAGGTNAMTWEGHDNPAYTSPERSDRRGSLSGGDFDNNNSQTMEQTTPTTSLQRQNDGRENTARTDVTHQTIMEEDSSTGSSQGHS